MLLEMSGHPAAIQQGFKALRAGGRASLLGIPTENVQLDLVQDVIFKGATVQGIYGRRMYGTWVQMTALLKAGRVNLKIRFLANGRDWMDLKKRLRNCMGGLAGKILLYPNGYVRLRERITTGTRRSEHRVHREESYKRRSLDGLEDILLSVWDERLRERITTKDAEIGTQS